MNDSLLPPSATSQERAIESATRRIGAVPTPLAGTWNPDTCPAHLLPWLAWALSVDNWDSRWSEAKKREVIRASVLVHRKKGTRHALERALGALSVRIEFQEWFEPDADDTRPHTFTLTTLANEAMTPDGEAILDANLYNTVFRIVDAVKPVRSHYHLRVGASYANSIKLAPAVKGGSVTSERTVTEVKSVVRYSAHGMAGNMSAVGALREQVPVESRPVIRRQTPMLATAARALSFAKVTMEVS